MKRAAVTEPTLCQCQIRRAEPGDLQALTALEQRCFASDRLSRRSFRHHLRGRHSALLVAEQGGQLLGYGLLLLLRGTRLARVYSLAVEPQARGQAIGEHLLKQLEEHALSRGRVFMRLEVAVNNAAAIGLYERCGYRRFGLYSDYYQDHQDALRLQKLLRAPREQLPVQEAPWYGQTTHFSCGPAALMMAMAALDESIEPNQTLELELWRESTTIFMTSGLGGTHPFGLALAAARRGLAAAVYLNSEQPLFIDGVRSDDKKQVMTLVHQTFLQQCQQAVLPIHYREFDDSALQQWLQRGSAVLMLISTYRMDGKKAPHWVLVTGLDQHCIYLHDPDVESDWQQPIDCQHLPIARADFDKMSQFGAARLRCAVVLANSAASC